ncbi:Protein of unknown function, partial [Gryllus bimaculatus]
MLLRPYQPSTWLCLGLILLSGTVSWHIVGAFDIKSVKSRRTYLGLSGDYTRSFVDVIRIIITGTAYIKVNFLPKRMCLLSLLILSLVITNAYAGQILSFLTTPTYWRDINTLEEVALQ